jgi:hypothetical protein
MAECRNVRQERGLHVLAGDEHVDGIDTGAARRIDEVFALGDEEAELVPPASVVELADELELLVLARSDQDLRRRLATPTIEVAWVPSTQASNAAPCITKRWTAEEISLVARPWPSRR